MFGSYELATRIGAMAFVIIISQTRSWLSFFFSHWNVISFHFEMVEIPFVGILYELPPMQNI